MYRYLSLSMVSMALLSGCESINLAVKDPESPRWLQTHIAADETLIGSDFTLLDAQRVVIVGDSNEASFALGSSIEGEVQWYLRADTGLSNLYSTHITHQGSVIVAGDYPSEATGVQQAYVMSLNGAGKLHWQTQYESKDDVSIFAIDELSDRSLIFAGASFPQGSSEKFDALGDSFVMRTSALGEVQWIKRIRLPQDDQVQDVVALPDDSILALINNTDEDGRNLGMRLLRLSTDGAIIFSDKLRVAGVIEGVSLSVDAHRQRVWLAGAQDIPAEDDADAQLRSVLVEMDFAGRILRYIYDGNNEETMTVDLLVAENGELHTIGNVQKPSRFEDVDVLYRRLDASGNELERKTFGGESVDIGHGITLLHDGRAVLLMTANMNDLPQLMLVSQTPN